MDDFLVTPEQLSDYITGYLSARGDATYTIDECEAALRNSLSDLRHDHDGIKWNIERKKLYDHIQTETQRN